VKLGKKIVPCGEARSYPSRDSPRHLVSNAVSNVKKLVHSVAKLSRQMVQQNGEFWTSENVGEQGIWP
jgi:hypothetical protein